MCLQTSRTHIIDRCTVRTCESLQDALHQHLLVHTGNTSAITTIGITTVTITVTSSATIRHLQSVLHPAYVGLVLYINGVHIIFRRYVSILYVVHTSLNAEAFKFVPAKQHHIYIIQ